MKFCDACNSTNLEHLRYRGDLSKNKFSQIIRGYVFFACRYLFFLRHFVGDLFPRRLYQAVFIPKLLIRCNDCGFGKISPMPSLQELELYYNEFYAPLEKMGSHPNDGSAGPALETACKIDYILWATRSSNLKTSLDFGAGNGHISLQLNKKRPDLRLFACDVETKSRRLKELGIFEKVFQAGVPLNQQFDLVIVCEVWEHLTEAESSLCSFWSLVKPGGYLYLAIPNSNATYYKIEDRSDAPHTLFFTKKSAELFLLKLNPLPELIQIDAGGRMWTENWNFDRFKSKESFLSTSGEGSDLWIVAKKPDINMPQGCDAAHV